MRLALHWKIVIGLSLGLGTGLALNEWGSSIWTALGVGDAKAFMAFAASDANSGAGTPAAVARFFIKLNQLVGDLFLRCLKFISVPIILFLLVVAVGGVQDLRKLGRVGARTVALFITTALLSITTGLLIGNIVRPGAAISTETRDAIAASQASAAAERIQRAHGSASSAWEFIRSLVSTNPFDSLARGDTLQVVMFALALGLALGLIPKDKSRPVIEVFDGLANALIALVGLIMKAAPFAVFALITPIMADLGFDLLKALLAYCLSVVGGLCVVLFVIYPIVLRVLTPMRPTAFFKGLAPAQLFAFTSSSSAATLPVTIQCVRNRLGVSEEVTGFVCSLGTSLNMDGTAVMQCVAATFIAQLYGQELAFTQQLVIAFTALLAAIGSPGIPSGGIVMLVVVLETAGLPIQGIAVILAVDRILDMCRTVVNVTGDALACVVVSHAEGELPKPQPAA